MAGEFTQPRDLRPQQDADAQLRRLRGDPPAEPGATGRGQPETKPRRDTAHEDSATKSSRVYFFVIAAIIAAAIAVFLILHPRGGG